MTSKRDFTLGFAAAAHGEQQRKYGGGPYIHHLIAVATLVMNHITPGDHNSDAVCAALLHDVLEDTSVSEHTLQTHFNNHVLSLVTELTDQFTHEHYPGLNRAERKALECDRLARISPLAASIKLCDMIDNTADITVHDPKFAIVYAREKVNILLAFEARADFDQINPYLFTEATTQINRFLDKIDVVLPPSADE